MIRSLTIIRLHDGPRPRRAATADSPGQVSRAPGDCAGSIRVVRAIRADTLRPGQTLADAALVWVLQLTRGSPCTAYTAWARLPDLIGSPRAIAHDPCRPLLLRGYRTKQGYGIDERTGAHRGVRGNQRGARHVRERRKGG